MTYYDSSIIPWWLCVCITIVTNAWLRGRGNFFLSNFVQMSSDIKFHDPEKSLLESFEYIKLIFLNLSISELTLSDPTLFLSTQASFANSITHNQFYIYEELKMQKKKSLASKFWIWRPFKVPPPSWQISKIQNL